MYKTAPIHKRLIAFLIDHFFILIWSMPVVLGIPFLQKIIWTKFGNHLILTLMFAIFGLYFIKDIKDGVSPGKNLLRIRVSNYRNGRPTKFQLIFRNITLFVWPLEIILMGLNEKKQKFGDLICRTKVIEFKKEIHRKKLLGKYVLIAILCISYGVISFFIQFRYSETVTKAIELLKQDEEIISEIGKVQKVGILVGGSLSKDTSVIDINLIGEHKEKQYVVKVLNDGGVWKILEVH